MNNNKITAVLGPTNTGKTFLAIETMLSFQSGMIGFPLRLLAREVYDKVIKKTDPKKVADKTHYHRGPHCTLPAVKAIGCQLLCCIGQQTIKEDGDARAAALQQCPSGGLIHRLEYLGVDLAEHAAVGNGNGQYAGGWAQAYGPHEQQCPNDPPLG